MTVQDYKAPESLGRLQNIALAAGVFGLVGGALEGMRASNQAQFFYSYLVGFLLILGFSLGSLGLLMLQHLTGGHWGIVIRRPLEAATRNLWLVFVLFIPIILGMKHLYSAWLDEEKVKEEPLSAFQQTYLTHNGFIVRAVIYFAVWILLMVVFNMWSKQQDVNKDDRSLRRRLKMLAGPGIILYVFAMSFAAIDWVMSITPHWASTIYGFLFVVGQLISSLSLIICIVVLLSRSKPFDGVLQARHLHALGKFLLAFVMLWAYFGFSQLLIIWAGNQPEEITFYRSRLYGGWGVVAVIVLVFHFFVPFFLLLSRDLKRNPNLLPKVAIWLIFMRWVDLFWMTRPEFSKDHVVFSILDVLLPVGLIGIWLFLLIVNLKQQPLLPLGEPKLAEAIEHDEH
jgi:hypothetical protein